MRSPLVIKRVLVGLAILVMAQLAWEHTPASRYYHRAVAACAQVVCGHVTVDDNEFLVSVGGGETLHVGALDITGNLCVLLALIVVSPVRPRLRSYLRAALTALVLLFVLHVGGLYVIVKTALAWHAGLTERHGEGVIADLGPWMYPLAVLLWLPYLLARQRDAARPSARGRAPRPDSVHA